MVKELALRSSGICFARSNRAPTIIFYFLIHPYKIRKFKAYIDNHTYRVYHHGLTFSLPFPCVRKTSGIKFTYSLDLLSVFLYKPGS